MSSERVLVVTPDLRRALARARAWNEEASEELRQLGEKAEKTCDYRYRDERSADHGETAWELLDGLLSHLEAVKS
ncbi:hypothetical protein AB0J80_35955 [Actinoplanes sp. NPDC049548]|uniref:hypothetical protein n=1 Tax=Actinoplanes sp. NPDC049548 TaxID=3155152 RepID=UPI0034407949